MDIRRPLKRALPKLGPPDIYPQDPKQKEDELTSMNVKQGYTSAPLISGPNNFDEFGTAKNADISASGCYISALLNEKHRINTLKDTQKKKQLVNTKEIWYVHAKTKHAVDNWFRDLANGTKSMGFLGKKIPIFNSKEVMFAQLYESHVPLAKAVWFIKMSAVHAIALSESSSKSKKRQVPDQYQELTIALIKYLKEVSIKLSECYQQYNQHHIPLQQQQQQQQLASQQWQYQTQLARYLFDEGLLDQYEFLCFLLELIEKKRPINDLLVKVFCPIILEYVIDFSKSAVLSRRLAHVCAKKLCQAFSAKRQEQNNVVANNSQHQSTSSSSSIISNINSFPTITNKTFPLSKSPSSTIRSINYNRNSDTHSTSSLLLKNSVNSNHLSSSSILDMVKAQVIESQNNLFEDPSSDQEDTENNLHKNAIYILSSILQVICIECPTAMVRHHIVDAKLPPMFQGSPLDHLPCLPSNLPMMQSDLNLELRKSVHDAEREILLRSAMADSKWSCDSSCRADNFKGGLVNRLLTVLEILDKHNFDKIDSSNSIDILYQKIFHSSGNDSACKTNNLNPNPPPSETSVNSGNSSSILDLSASSQMYGLPSNVEQSKKSRHLHSNSMNTSSLESDIKESSATSSYDEHILKLLCEWATTTQRTGEHRALVVARLFEKRQSEFQESLRLSFKNQPSTNTNTGKHDDLKANSSTNANDKPSEPISSDEPQESQEEYVHFSLQNLLVQFLDENASITDNSHSINFNENKKAFKNLVLLFGELIRSDVFSHYNYMCTLISRGMFNDLSKSAAVDSTTLDSPAPGSNAPSSVKPPRSVGRESDSILANTIQGLSSNSNMYPLSVATNTSSQNNYLEPLMNNKVVPGADQSSRSLGFSPVSSQNVSQDLDKSHGLLDNHMDDVDADLGKILQNINEGQQDEAADILLPDYLGGSREDSSTRSQQINKISPFGLTDRPSIDNSSSNHQGIIHSNSFGLGETKPNIVTGSTPEATTNSTETSGSKNPSETRHMTFVKHFPVPDDDNFIQDLNQRNFLLYGFGKEREEARHALKKLNKEICKLFNRKAARDINDGGKTGSKKLAQRDTFNPEVTLHKFESLSHHDQHVITNSLSLTIVEMFNGVSNGQTSLLPTLESMSFIFDLFSMASNVSGLLELLVPILEELPDIEAQIKLKCPILTNQYTHSIALCMIGMLYRYHSSVMLLSRDDLTIIFESLFKLVQHVNNPTNSATSAERVILCYLYDLYSSQTGKLFDQYSSLIQRVKQGILQTNPTMAYSCTDFDWQPSILSQIATQIRQSHLFSNSVTNPIMNAGSASPSLSSFSSMSTGETSASIRQQLYMPDSPVLRQLNEISVVRFRFVCDAIFLSATASHPNFVNDIAVLCADVTSKCQALVGEWISAFQALCCPAQRETGYRQLYSKVNVSEPQVMDNLAIFTAILVARRCMQLSVFILDCAIGAILAPLSSVDKSLTEPGARLTCHLLLTLFKNRDHPFNQAKSETGNTTVNQPNPFSQGFSNYGGNTPNYSSILGQVPNMGLLQAANKEQDLNSRFCLNLKYLCDHYLLRSACTSIKTECHITLLKAIRFLAMSANPTEQELQGRIKTETTFEDINCDAMNFNNKDIDALGCSPRNLNTDPRLINLQTASLHQFADAILRLLCSQRWLHNKCLSDSEIFTDTEKNILLDPRIDVKQSQRLLYMICYNKSPEKQVDVGLDDQGSDQVASIVKMFESLDVWTMRLSLMRLQFMFAYCKSQSNVMLNDWLDNLAKAVVDFFQKASQENEYLDKDNDMDTAKDTQTKKKDTKVPSASSSSITNINKVWLIEPLLDKLAKPPSSVQSKIIRASAALMESASVRANSLPSLNQTYLSTAAASTKFKERTLSQRGSASANPSNLASTSLLGFQPFLSLLLSCLKNQDKERETLLTSLNSQLYQAIHEKVDDIGYKQSIQDGLELRICLIGQMFDTIQKSPNLTSDWATLLLLLIMNNLVDPQIDYGLYVSVLDMLAMLIHAAYASDPLEQKEDAKKQYQNLMKKFRKELIALEEKGILQMKLINPLLPLVRQMTRVVTCEPMGSLVDTKGEKVENFFSIDKKRGLKVSELQEVSPWELIEGHKNPAPLSWPWFGAIRLDNKPLRSEENNRLMSWHTHNIRHSTAYFCQYPLTDDGPSSAKRSNTEKKLSQSNPLLKSLIEANDDSIGRKENELCNSTIGDDNNLEGTDENILIRDEYVEDYCIELPINQLFDPTPIELMIEDIKTAMQAEQAAMTARAKSQNVDTKPIINPQHQASSILAPVQPDPNRSQTPQVSALSALQNHLNTTTSSVDSSTSLLASSGPSSVQPPPMVMSPIVNPLTPELMPTRPSSNIPKIVPTPPPHINVIPTNRSMSPMVARSPAIAATPTPPPPKPRPPRKKRQTKKDVLANAIIDTNANISANVNKNTPQPGMMQPGLAPYGTTLDGINHIGPPHQQIPPQMMMSHTKLVANNQPVSIPMNQLQQPGTGQGMIIRRAPMTQPQPPPPAQVQQQASVYDFQPYQQPPPHNQQQSTNQQFVNPGTINNYYDQQRPASGNTMFSQQQQAHPTNQVQQQAQLQMSMVSHHQPHPLSQGQQGHPIQQPQQQQQPQHPHHHGQYIQGPTQHQHPIQPQQQHQSLMQAQTARLANHQHQQQAMSFQQMQQHPQQQQIFAPQQAAGHSRPALTAMLHQKHAAAGNVDNKMHPQPRFNFG